MSLQRTCYLCGKPVSIRRQMSVFCSARCEQRFRVLTGAEGPSRPQTRPPQPPRKTPSPPQRASHSA